MANNFPFIPSHPSPYHSIHSIYLNGPDNDSSDIFDIPNTLRNHRILRNLTAPSMPNAVPWRLLPKSTNSPLRNFLDKLYAHLALPFNDEAIKFIEEQGVQKIYNTLLEEIERTHVAKVLVPFVEGFLSYVPHNLSKGLIDQIFYTGINSSSLGAIKFAMEHGLIIKSEDEFLLMNVIIQGDLEVIRYLIPYFDTKNIETQQNMLKYSIMNDTIQVLRYLIEDSPIPFSPIPNSKWNIWTQCVIHDNLEAIKYLLYPWGPLDYDTIEEIILTSASYDRVDIIDLMFKYLGSDVHRVNVHEVLLNAIYRDKIDAFQHILYLWDGIFDAASHIDSLTHRMAQCGALKIMQYFVETYYPLKYGTIAPIKKRKDMLMAVAACSGEYNMVKYLIEKHNAKTYPSYMAPISRMNHLNIAKQMIRYLKQAGVDIHYVDWTLLCLSETSKRRALRG